MDLSITVGLLRDSGFDPKPWKNQPVNKHVDILT